MARYKVDITGINTSELKVLTSKEMVELFKRYHAGDMQAKEELEVLVRVSLIWMIYFRWELLG